MKVESVSVRDVRFPTSRERDGSDSMNEGDYSATYVTLGTEDGLEGHGLTFTNGRGNELCVAAVKRSRTTSRDASSTRSRPGCEASSAT